MNGWAVLTLLRIRHDGQTMANPKIELGGCGVWLARAAVCVSSRVDAALCDRVKMSWIEFP